MTAERLLRQWEQIDKLHEKLQGFTVLKGVEVDILEQGGLDIDDETLSHADWVVASVHYGQKQPREQITKRIVDALANPNVCAIAHPTGRIINRRKPYDVDLEAVYEAAKQARQIPGAQQQPGPARSGRHPLRRLPRARHSDRHLDRCPQHAGTRRPALRHPASPARTNQRARGEYSQLGTSEKELLGKK